MVYMNSLKDTQRQHSAIFLLGTKYTVEEVADSDYDASVKVNNTVQNADSTMQITIKMLQLYRRNH